jgi:histone H3
MTTSFGAFVHSEQTKNSHCSRSLTTDATSELNVLGHDGDTLGVNGAEVGVFKESNEVGLSSFLEGQHGRALEAKVTLKVLSNLTDETLEGQLADQQVSGLLVTTDLTESHGTRTVTVRLLDSTGRRGTLASCLGCKLLARGFACRGKRKR